MDEAGHIRAAVAGVVSRLRLASLVRHAAFAVPTAVALESALVLPWRLHAVSTLTFLALTAALAGALVLYLVVRARPVAPLAAAQQADEVLALHDRLTSALTFLEMQAPGALELAAIGDGARVAAALDPSQVVALRVPRTAFAIPLAALLVGLALLAHPRLEPVKSPPPVGPRFVVEADALLAERQAVRRMAQENKGKDPELSALAQKLDALLAAVDQQKLSREEAFAQLAKIEAGLKTPASPPLKPSEALKPAANALAKSRATEKLAEAIKKDDLDAAQKELEKLAEQAEKRDAEDKDQKDAREEMERALDRASQAMREEQKKRDDERDKQVQKLEDEQRRLQKQKQEHPDDEETERKLQKNKRELERLEKEKQEQKEQRRELQRLQKEMQDAAEELRKKMSPEAMRQMAEDMKQMENEIKKLGSQSQGRMQIAELKEVLRRAGRVEAGNGQGKDGQGKDGQGRDGKGNGKEKNGRGQKLADFDKRAGGQNDTLVLGGNNGDGETVMLPLPMPGGEAGGAGGEKGEGDPKGPGDDKGPGNDKGGDGIGNQHDPNLMGDKSRLAEANKMLHAKGKAGAGPSRSQTILGASEKGFSSHDYHKVYDDYHAVVEEVMSQENVPPGYRYYVKRYFQLIRPRE